MLAVDIGMYIFLGDLIVLRQVAAQARGILYIPPQVPVYQGMIVGLSNKKDDLDELLARLKSENDVIDVFRTVI